MYCYQSCSLFCGSAQVSDEIRGCRPRCNFIRCQKSAEMVSHPPQTRGHLNCISLLLKKRFWKFSSMKRCVPSSKLTWQWKFTFSNRKYIFKWWIFHSYVSLPEYTSQGVQKIGDGHVWTARTDIPWTSRNYRGILRTAVFFSTVAWLLVGRHQEGCPGNLPVQISCSVMQNCVLPTSIVFQTNTAIPFQNSHRKAALRLVLAWFFRYLKNVIFSLVWKSHLQFIFTFCTYFHLSTRLGGPPSTVQQDVEKKIGHGPTRGCQSCVEMEAIWSL